jgi:SPP1 family predicted phage head-tail adaptor
MRAGMRRSWIGIYPSTEAAGDSGDPQPSWSSAPTVECWAHKRNMSQRESVIAGSVQDANECVFEVLYVEGITTKHRIKFGASYYDITGISDKDERHETLAMYAREGLSYGS